MTEWTEKKKTDGGDAEEMASQMEQLTITCKTYRRELKKLERTHGDEMKKLTREIESLQLEMCRVQDRLDYWKTTCQRQQNESVVIAKSKLVSKENETLKEDLEVLKTVVRRLNNELAFYQSQIRKEYLLEPSQMPRFCCVESDSEDSVKKDDLNRASKTILPLLVAYDEAIDEKKGIIDKHERLVEEFKTKLLTITDENGRLHQQISEFNAKGTISNEEWKTLSDNAVLVLQENDLLHEKIDVLNRKIAAMGGVHEEKVEKLKKRISFLEEDKASLKSGLTEMQNQCASLTLQITKLSIAIKERIPKDQHEASVNECKREFVLLKSKYEDERRKLAEKLNDSSSENKDLKKEVESANSSVVKLQQSVKELEKSNLEYAGSLVILKKELSISVKAFQLNECSLKEMMTFAESVKQEKNVLERSINDQRQSTEKIMAVRNQEVALLKDFEEKLRAIQENYERKLQQYIARANKLESYMETMADRHQADISHLHDLVQEKSIHIQRLNNEKKQLMEDLETVWRATTKDQQNALWNRAPPNVVTQSGKKSSPGELKESSAVVPRRGSDDTT